jgi:hypothetical protein
MKNMRSNSSVAAASFALLLIALGGCGSSDTRPIEAPPPAPKQAQSTPSAAAVSSANAVTAAAVAPSSAAFRQELTASSQQIDRVLASLNVLADPGTQDLRAAYNDYSDQLARMNGHADQLKREADAMRASQKEYFAAWEQKVAQIDNPTIRAAADARRARIRDSQERIAADTLDARDAYGPFMRDLQDVRKFLGSDLSKQNTSLLGDVQTKARGSGATVKSKLSAIIAELDSIDAAGT